MHSATAIDDGFFLATLVHILALDEHLLMRPTSVALPQG